MTKYKIIISSLWWGAGLAILLLFLWLTANPAVFGNQTDKAIDWIIPHLIPTLTLTGAVAFVQRGGAEAPAPPTDQMKHAFLLTMAISAVYLLVLGGALVLSISGAPGETANGVIDRLYDWNKILGVIQGLAASAIGVFFVRAEKDSTAKAPDKKAA